MWKIPLFDTYLTDAEKNAVQSVLESGWLTMGETTRQFEAKFADFIGTKYAIAVTNGTAALHLANLAMNIAAGDEVICPSLSFVAGANSILYVGAQPVFADIAGIDNLCISPEEIEKKITKKTKAIQVMHYAGNPCNMDAIIDIAGKHHLPIIEDCAHAPGADYKGKRCGSIGAVGCFSFFSNKNMTTAEGGMVTTDNDFIAKKIRLLRTHGMTTVTLDRHYGHAMSYDVLMPGFNYRIDEIRSAMGIVQLDMLNGNNIKRENLRKEYIKRLSKCSILSIPFLASDHHKPAYHLFPVILADGIHRHDFMKHLNHCGIQTSIHYPPIHRFSYYQQALGSDCCLSNTENAAAREVTLPFYPSMTLSELDDVAAAIEAFQESLEVAS